MDKIIKERIKNKLALVPTLPGSYQMKNKDGIIIYVGKAKNLQRRLRSYFTRTVTGKTLMLVEDIYDFDYIVTSSELESLILEITLIKKYDPKYNILLRDDKSYPYIELTSDKYPRLKIVRNVKRNKNKSKLFGPYPNVSAARDIVNMLNRLYPLRKCDNLQKDLCLYYHIGECLGYCKKEIDSSVIDNMKAEIISFLKGNSELIVNKITKEMEKASNALNYERALELKNMLNNINITLTKQKIDLNKNYNFDLFNYAKDENYLSIEVFFVREGLLFGKHSEIITSLDDDVEEMHEYIIKFYEKNGMIPKEVVVPFDDTELLSNYLNVKVNTYKRGDIKKLLDLAHDNASISLYEKEEKLIRDENARCDAIIELKNKLGMNKLERIEIFDNSHLFGTFYVGAMVLFENFIPKKDEYRKFKIDANVKDDLSAMKEVLYRRYYRVLMDGLKIPDLVIVDGGELQVNVAKEIIESLKLNIKIIGLKKDDRHRTNMIVDSDLNEISLDVDSNLFLYLSKMQEEVHNFVINYHRSLRSKGALSSLLDVVPGIGEVRRKDLIKKFGSLKKIKEASVDELETVLNHDVAVNLYNYLKDLDN